MTSAVNLDETSPSVQTHLQLLQSVIQRMAANSSSSKAWCITIVSAVIVLTSDKGTPNFALIAVFPTFLFFCLDAYYLSLEKGFRKTYTIFVTQLHSGEITPKDLYEVKISGSQCKHQLSAMQSFSVWGFYLSIAVFIVFATFLLAA